mmetsp:Transcript_53206/g.126948  ORF Transcript_53206/g.126948 Transcript_53206/m.126948 type:complete len:221 (-) Transcript_53206:90-752(-)
MLTRFTGEASGGRPVATGGGGGGGKAAFGIARADCSLVLATCDVEVVSSASLWLELDGVEAAFDGASVAGVCGLVGVSTFSDFCKGRGLSPVAGEAVSTWLAFGGGKGPSRAFVGPKGPSLPPKLPLDANGLWAAFASALTSSHCLAWICDSGHSLKSSSPVELRALDDPMLPGAVGPDARLLGVPGPPSAGTPPAAARSFPGSGGGHISGFPLAADGGC